MFARTVDRAFARFRTAGDSRALALVFDRTAPELLALGRRLASGEAAAEDLVQATFLTAIEDKDSHDGARAVLPWLIGILANHAREARRRGRRELDPARLRQEQLTDPVREAEGRELDTELAGAIARLPEPYRPVLRLFLQHGFEPAEIALTLERPDGTVRAQLHRGLDRLRKLLPAGLVSAPAGARVPGRGLQAVRAAVLLRCGAESTAVPTAVTVGALAMLLNKKVALTAAALALCGSLGFAVFTVPAPASSREAGAGPAVVAATDTQSPLEKVVPTETGASASARVEQLPAAQPVTGAIHVCVERGRDHVRLPGIGLAVVPRDEAEHSHLTTFREFTFSDAQGEASFADLAPGDYVVDIDRQGFGHELDEPTVVVAGRTAERVVAVRNGMRVEGSVVDPDGRPVEGAAVCLHASRLGSVTLAHSDHAGRFACDGLTDGVELQARLPGRAPSRAATVPSVRDGVAEVRLELGGAGCVITGRVRDGSDAPIAGALVALHAEVPLEQMASGRGQPQVRAVFVRTDAAGAFRCDEVAAGATVLTACARGGWAPTSIGVTAGTVPVHVDVVLGAGAVVEGTVLDGGVPARDAMVFAFLEVPDAKPTYLFNLLGFHTVQLDADGRFRIAGLMSGELQVSAVRGRNEVIDRRAVTVAAGQTVRCDLTGKRAPEFTVRIEPVRAPGAEPRWLAVLRRLDQAGTETAPAVQYTDAEGCAKFGALPGRCELWIGCEPARGDMLVLVRREIAVTGGETRIQVPAERTVLQPVRGRLVDATLAPVGAVVLSLTGTLGGADPVHLERTTGADGRFEFAGLPSGRYQLTAKGSEGPPRAVSDVLVAGDREEDLGDVRLPR